MDVPYREAPGFYEETSGESPSLGSGSASTLEMTEAQKRAARKREATKVIGFAPPESDG
jgi:hypothetical protein